MTELVKTAIKTALASLPPPSRFPVPFKEFLRLLIGGDSVADREKLFRDYCRDELRRKRALAQNVEPHLEPLPEAFDPEVEERWANWKTHGISKGEYIDVFRRFKLWREQRQAMAARRATAKRWPQPAAD